MPSFLDGMDTSASGGPEKRKATDGGTSVKKAKSEATGVSGKPGGAKKAILKGTKTALACVRTLEAENRTATKFQKDCPGALSFQ